MSVSQEKRKAMAELKVFFVGGEISRHQARHGIEEGRLLKVGRGIYMTHPAFADPEMPQAKWADAINRSLRENALRIVMSRYPGSVLAMESAARQRSDHCVTIYANGAPGTVEIGRDLLEQLPASAANRIRFLRVERIRPQAEMVEDRDWERVTRRDKGFSGWMAENDDVRKTTPRRTLVDLGGEPDRFAGLTENERRYLAASAGMPTEGRALENRIREALVLLREEFPWASDAALEAVGDQLYSLARANPRVAIPGAGQQERFVLRWHGMAIGQLVYDGSRKWQFYREPGWPLRLWSTDKAQDFPPFLAGMFPEQRRFNPGERAGHLRQYPRMMSNLTIAPAGDPPPEYPEDRVTQTLDQCRQEGAFFAGELDGLPKHDEAFLVKAQQIMLRNGVTQISGAQVKIPMHLSEGRLAVAENAPFTHILKLPMLNRMQNLPVLEWMGMSLARAAGVEVPRFCLVRTSGAGNRRLDGVNHALGAVSREIQAMPDPGATDPDSVIRSLSQALRDVGEQEIPQQYWDELQRQAARAGGDLFAPLARESTGGAPPAYLVERFDIPGPGMREWRFAEDFCAVSGRLSDVAPESKYEGSMEEVARLLREESSNWQMDARRLFRQTVANVLICNNDGHLKNFSLLRRVDPSRQTILETRLSPAYDLTVTAELMQGDLRQALPIYGETRPDREVLLHYGVEACQIPEKEAEAICNQMALSVRAAMPRVLGMLPESMRTDPVMGQELKRAGMYVLEVCNQIGRLDLRRKPREEAGVAP